MSIKTCEICGKILTPPEARTYVDGKTKGGPWAEMCVNCHHVYGTGFGLGKGQEFDLATGKKLRG